MKCSECNKKSITMIEGTLYCKEHTEIDITDYGNKISKMVYLEKKFK